MNPRPSGTKTRLAAGGVCLSPELLRELLGDVQERLNVRGVSPVGHQGLDHPERG
ncbi:hypothetical protein ACFWAZ_11210 [Streptomyces collinus]|uniref:hypothetical protein n=1 Tax=Streptomyces collinus TaxID=42684 RepID=UPI00364BB3DD